MIDNELIQELTESYLQSLIAEVSGVSVADFDTHAPFGELGIDSFHVLEVVKKLESDFGTLPKTLLFENFNINDLANYFVNEHEVVLAQKFNSESSAPGDRMLSNEASSKVVSSVKAVSSTERKPLYTNTRERDQAPARASVKKQQGPILISEARALADPVLGDVIGKIFSEYKNEGSASRGTRNIAPNIFLGTRKLGYLNYARHNNIMLAYSYTGPEDYFIALLEEFLSYCEGKKFDFNLLAGSQIESLSNTPISSTPFGVVQKIVNIQDFSLKGGKMRRLRYQVSKFANTGECRTEEYRCGSHSETDHSIAQIIDKWCDAKTMVNPLIHIVKEEILDGSLNPEHRIFVTYLDDVLQNVILISPVSTEKGYLMDLEFYPAEMPLGGLEYAIVNIIQLLAAEGNSMLSLGGTYGCKLAPSPNADPALDKILDQLREKEIFNDGGNMQFKNKFRPENKSVYICRKVEGSNPNNVTDIIMMIADPARMQTSDDENHIDDEVLKQFAVTGIKEREDFLDESEPTSKATSSDGMVIEGEWRSQVLADYGYNPLNIPDQHIDFDLKTDSWAQQSLPVIDQLMSQVHESLQQAVAIEDNLSDIFSFDHLVFSGSGRTAEHLFFKAYPKNGTVLQNLLFPTTIFHQIDNGFKPMELPCQDVFDLDSEEFYRGNLDLESLQVWLESDAETTALVYVEVNNNAAGGRPVSVQHLKEIKSLLSKYSIPLILDGTRVVENAILISEHEEAYSEKTIWEIVRELFSFADAVVASLPKDFCVDRGGLIATNDAALFDRIQVLVDEEGSGLDVVDKKVIKRCLNRRQFIENQVRNKMESVRRLHRALRAHDVPMLTEIGGHCVIIDVGQIREFDHFEHPVASFVAWMYLNTGIRGGAHSVGKQKNSTLNKLVRLAVPIGLESKAVDEMAVRMIQLFESKQNIPEVALQKGNASSLANMSATYHLVNYHSPSSVIVRKLSAPAEVESQLYTAPAGSLNSDNTPAFERQAQVAVNDIAIVGMAGRYPGARNPDQLWENLAQGIDCIKDIPDSRLQLRQGLGSNVTYRGGFIDEVDSFDADFFNVSDKEAVMLDPQERVFMEVCWEALEDAGYYPETLAGESEPRDIGVYVGAVWSMYQMIGLEEKFSGNQVSPNSFFWSIANRVSFWMNLSGPSLTLDTACSSSLTSVNLACEAIARGECSMAIVGGVNLDLHQSKFDINSVGGTLSSRGACRSFGSGADGYVSGEGVGAVLLKPLAQAVKDRDNIHGVIKSAVVNHSGRTSGYTIPSSAPQTRLVLKALEKAGVSAKSIGYIEAHGTATELGDAIEISGLSSAYKKYDVETMSCPIGSVKTNIGHLEAASGIVGMQKILLQMKHRKLAPSLHSAELNPTIDFEHSPFYVVQSLSDWAPTEFDDTPQPLRAGISAFGAGGANAHVILEQYQSYSSDVDDETHEHVFPISAKTEQQLLDSVIRLRAFVERDISLTDAMVQSTLNNISHTLRRGRKCFDHRLVCVAKSKLELIQKLTSYCDGDIDNGVFSGHVNNAVKVTELLNRKEKREFIEMLSKSSDLRRLSQLWCDGLLENWHGVQVAKNGRKVSLPTYPFARNSYWISTAKNRQNVAVMLEQREHVNGSVATKNEVDQLRDKVPDAELGKRDKKTTTEAVYEFFKAGEVDEQAQESLSLSTEEKSELFVRQLFSEKLRLPINEIDLNCQLMETGVTSVLMAEMTMSIKSKLDAGFSPTVFFECTTLRSLSEQLLQTYETVFSEMLVIKRSVQNIDDELASGSNQREDETVLTEPESIALHLLDADSKLPRSRLKKTTKKSAYSINHTLLTGATGFLGIHILAEVLSSHKNAKVFCLVRATDQEHALKRILLQAKEFELSIDVTRVVVLCGDVEKPQFGISRKEWELCSREVHQIIHASAHVNHIEGYSTFRESVRGMKEIIRFAGIRHRKLIHFVSSISACMHKTGDEFSIYENEDFIENGEVVFGGYGQSKWVQETYLNRASNDSDIPYLIYRFGELSGSSMTGLGRTEDMLHRLLQMRLAIGCKEKISSDVLDMVPVDLAAKLIVKSATQPKLYNRIFHATHTEPYSVTNLYRQVEKYDLQFEPVTREHYLKRCYDFVKYISTANPVNGFVLECVLRDTEGSSRNLKAMDGYFAVLFPFNQTNFIEALEATELILPEWKTLFEKYFSKWKEPQSGYMDTIFSFQAWSKRANALREAPNSSPLSLGNEPAPKTKNEKSTPQIIVQD